MNYIRIYNQLIDRARNRDLVGYGEKHHVIPRCLGGDDSKENLVKLTPEEHYVAHQLLIKMYPNNHALAKAAAMMISNRPTNKMYGWIRRRFSIAKSIEQSGQGNSQFGSRWAHNPITKENKKIKGDLEEGWVYGRYKPSGIDKMVMLREKRFQNRQKQVDIYRKYYIIYKEVGFNKFVELTGYNKSKANLVQRFASLLDEFVPQNGKKR
jgi:hypothetical protein